MSPPPSKNARSRSEALVYLTQAFPSLSPNKILSIHKEVSGSPSKGKKCPYSTTTGPTHRSIILHVHNESVSLLPLGMQLSCALAVAGHRIRIESHSLAYGSLWLTTTLVPSPTNIQAVESLAHTLVPKGTSLNCEVPSS